MRCFIRLNCIKIQKRATSTVAQDVSAFLGESVSAMERTVEQELQRIPTTGKFILYQTLHDKYFFSFPGSTPNPRQTNSFMEELVDMPPTQQIFDEQCLMVTPRRTSCFRARDSILDSAEFNAGMLSPDTLHSRLQSNQESQLDSVDEEEERAKKGSFSNSTTDYKSMDQSNKLTRGGKK
jgi:hypothetical protein